MRTEATFPLEPDEGYTYFIGRTTYFASSVDPRFSYCLYVPEQIRHICVYVHGTTRDAASFRDRLSAFAEAQQTMVICPLFPAGVIDPVDIDNYKYLLYRGIRFDLVMLSMIDEVCERYSLSVDRFLLGGFSGGAQFAHRFAYLHPGRVQALSLAAPGRVTLLDDSLDWWSGIRDVERFFGQVIDSDALRDMPIQLLVGEKDDADITVKEGSPYWAPGANRAGSTRRERLDSLYEQYRQIGCDVTLEVVEDCGHNWLPLQEPTVAFFESIIGGAR